MSAVVRRQSLAEPGEGKRPTLEGKCPILKDIDSAPLNDSLFLKMSHLHKGLGSLSAGSLPVSGPNPLQFARSFWGLLKHHWQAKRTFLLGLVGRFGCWPDSVPPLKRRCSRGSMASTGVAIAGCSVDTERHVGRKECVRSLKLPRL